ncbi:MAG: lamin tail domain-containing protein, partial [Flavobacteriales bacterium]|nr:lamin tail domain-containing protein [Flavobacteriales bacterium]
MKNLGSFSLVLTFLAAFVNHNSFSQLSINEFMAANSSAVTDPDYGNTADWVELYNSSAVNVDLSGYFLTDNLSDSTKYQIPAGTIINAGQFLIFWCDGDSAGVHTNFSLSSLGEEIGLYGPDQVLVDGLVYTTQETDISYGRSTDGATSW